MPKPYELSKAMAPHSGLLGASLGAGIGGLSGLMSDPGYDEETGDRKSRLRAILKGLTGGGLIGGAAGAAAPFAAEGYGRHVAGPVQSLLSGGEEKEVKAAVIYSLEKVSSYRKNQSAAGVKMAQAVLNMNAINQELAMHNFHQLRKSAAVGAHKEERLKVAALIRQSELEKQAFLSAFCKQAGNPLKWLKSLWSKPKSGVGKGVGGAANVGKGAGTIAKYFKGAPAAAKKPLNATGTARLARAPKPRPGNASTGAPGNAKSIRGNTPIPPTGPRVGKKEAIGLGTGAALTQIPGHTGPATGAKGGQSPINWKGGRGFPPQGTGKQSPINWGSAGPAGDLPTHSTGPDGKQSPINWGSAGPAGGLPR